MNEHSRTAEPTAEQRAFTAMLAERSQADAHTRSWTDFVHKCIDQRGQLINKEYLDEYIHMYTEVLAEEVGRIEKNIRADLIRKQDDAVTALRSEIAELRDLIAALQDQRAPIANNVIDPSKITPLKHRGSNAAGP